MSIDYEAKQQLALRLIADAGRTATVKRFGRDFDPITQGVESPAAIVGEVSLVVLPIKSSIAEKLERSLKQALTEGRLRMLLVAYSGAPFDIQPSDVFFLDDEYWHARGVNPLNPGGTTILYNVIAESTALSDEDLAAIDLLALEAINGRFHTWLHETLPEDVNG